MFSKIKQLWIWLNEKLFAPLVSVFIIYAYLFCCIIPTTISEPWLNILFDWFKVCVLQEHIIPLISELKAWLEKDFFGNLVFAGGLAFIAFVGLLLLIPDTMTELKPVSKTPSTQLDAVFLDYQAKYQAQAVARWTTAGQIAGGILLLLGAVLGYRRLRVAEANSKTEQDKLTTERFSRTVELLGHKEIDVRLGALHALKRIATDSDVADFNSIMEILSSYVKNRLADWREEEEYKEACGQNSGEYIPRLRIDIVTAINILSELSSRDDTVHRHSVRQGEQLRLKGNLYGLNFSYCTLENIQFSNLTLTNIDFTNAHLSHVEFKNTQLTHAYFNHAHLSVAHFENTTLGLEVHKNMSIESSHFENIKNTLFEDTSFNNVRFQRLNHVSFTNCTFNGLGSRFSGDLNVVNFLGGILKEVGFGAACDTEHCTLTDVYFDSNVKLEQGTFFGPKANPKSVYFTRADIPRDLRGIFGQAASIENICLPETMEESRQQLIEHRLQQHINKQP
ncbi:MAG: pentapeptide repeat-containing protein [Candidatus Melainabacteria bacterium]|nr:pentapeptide repeat-containing protein [Candidatus Melainabacteria bacterium]